MQNTVVVGYDISPEGVAVIGRGIEEARTRGAKLYVVHDLSSGDLGADLSHEVERYEADINRVAERLSGEGVQYETHVRVIEGSVVDSLIALAKELDPALFIIGLPRRSRVGKLLMGSTAQELLLGLDCPVLAVKSPESDRY